MLYIAKCTVLVRNVLSKQLHKLTLFIFVGLLTFRSCEVRLPPSLEFAPEVKQVRPHLCQFCVMDESIEENIQDRPI